MYGKPIRVGMGGGGMIDWWKTHLWVEEWWWWWWFQLANHSDWRLQSVGGSERRLDNKSENSTSVNIVLWSLRNNIWRFLSYLGDWKTQWGVFSTCVHLLHDQGYCLKRAMTIGNQHQHQHQHQPTFGKGFLRLLSIRPKGPHDV